jgi:UDPglucose 6-dehydrogenase
MKVGIIGGGTVGRATARCYLEHIEEVRVYDVLKERRTHGFDEVLECDLIFVCLQEDRLHDVFSYWAVGYPGKSNANFVLKSTVPIGTTRRLAREHHLPNLVHSPEFLTERCAMIDVQVPSRNIIGSPTDHVHNECAKLLHWLYRRRFPGVPTHCMTSDESEAVKLMTNAFFATKVSFFNEMRSLVDRLGLDWETVRAGVLSDGRIAHSHTQVPGPDGERGFGGKCLPKDLATLVRQFFEQGIDSPVCDGAALRNRVDRGEA